MCSRRARSFLSVVVLSVLPSAGRPLASAAGWLADGILESGKAFERQISGTQAHVYELPLAAGEYAAVRVEQRGIDVTLRVVDPAGQTLVSIDRETRTVGEEHVAVVAAAGGIYRIRVQPRYERAPAASYEIVVTDRRIATDGDRSAFEALRLADDAARFDSDGNYDAALEAATRAVNLLEQASGGQDPDLARLVALLGAVQRNKGAVSAAADSFARAIALSEAALGREHPQTAAAIQALGVLENTRGDYAKAEPLLEQALDITETVLGPEHPRVTACLRALSLLHIDRHDFKQGIPELERALAIAERTLEPDDFDRVAIVNNLGDAYLNLGDGDRAEPYFLAALPAIEKRFGPDNPRVAVTLLDLGSIARQKKQYARAIEILERAEAIRARTLGPRHTLTAEVMITLGNVYRNEGQYDKALDQYQNALNVLEESAGPYHRDTLLAVANAAVAYAASADVPHALEYAARTNRIFERNAQLNLAIGSERQKLAYLGAMSDWTDRTVSLYLRLAPANPSASDLAISVVLQRKGRTLDAMAGSVAAIHQRMDAGDAKLLDDLTRVSRNLATLAVQGRRQMPATDYRNQLRALEDEEEKLEAEISRRSPEFRAWSQPITLESVRAAVPAGAALVDFALYRPFDFRTEEYGEPHYAAYVIRHDAPAYGTDLGPAKPIDDAAVALREALRDPKRFDALELARAAYVKVLAPIRPQIGGPSRLLIAPDGELNLIPFEALADDHGYLIQQYAISYLTSGRDLLCLGVPRTSKSGPLVVADPLFGEAPFHEGIPPSRRPPAARRRSVTSAGDLSHLYFASLPRTAAEARAISALFPEATVLTRDAATVGAVERRAAPSILHFATHGFFLHPEALSPSGRLTAVDRRDAAAAIDTPLLGSGLALAGANNRTKAGDDGLLTAREASRLNLWGTRLVTLSACDTGVGEVRNGEGVFGLRRAFFLAGAETLVMSLWPVSDAVTREMMTAYYTGLRQGLGRGDALRRAQLTMLARRNRRHPFYWASFIEAGEWAALDGRR